MIYLENFFIVARTTNRIEEKKVLKILIFACSAGAKGGREENSGAEYKKDTGLISFIVMTK